MKFLLVTLVLFNVSAWAKSCNESISNLYPICTGDYVLNQWAKSEDELFGKVKKIKNEMYFIDTDSGKRLQVGYAVLPEKNLSCFKIYQKEVCVGDTVLTPGNTTPIKMQLHGIHQIRMNMRDEADGGKNVLYSGYDEKGRFWVFQNLVFVEGPVPGIDNVNFGQNVNGIVVKSFTSNIRFSYQLDGKKTARRGELLVLLGAKEIQLAKSNTDYISEAKTQKDLYWTEYGYMSEECRLLFRDKIVSLENVNIKISDVKGHTSVSFGDECLPLPIPWINRSTKYNVEATATCKVLGDLPKTKIEFLN